MRQLRGIDVISILFFFTTFCWNVIVVDGRNPWFGFFKSARLPSINHPQLEDEENSIPFNNSISSECVETNSNSKDDNVIEDAHNNTDKENESGKKMSLSNDDLSSNDNDKETSDAGTKDYKGDDDENEAPVVGVKSHHHHHHKKSNAVGDPDGEGSSDDDDDDDDDDDFSDWENEFFDNDSNDVIEDLDSVMEQVQVEVEYMEEDDNNEDEEQGSSNSGGVGVRLGRRFKQRNKNKKHSMSKMEHHLLDAWSPHVYLPPPDLKYLTEHARSIDGDSKIRLDRRTLYAGLLLEWSGATVGTNRRFLEKDVSQTLQSALSLASQPMWRRSFPRPSAIRLYDNNDEGANRGCTLAMQETIAMALAHSLGAGFVILDDKVLSSIRQQLIKNGISEENLKPATVIQSILALAKQGVLRPAQNASISDCMQQDLKAGLDDPFDERATSSCEEMVKWEQNWEGVVESEYGTTDLPLLIFLRVQSSSSLLKSKSAVEVLLSECNDRESRNLLVLGKGINEATTSLPREPEQSQDQMDANNAQMSNMPGTPPWLGGFAQHNQNASGQNDPEGSRRFNIFLARTMDQNGNPGIVGAVAPPEAGNLFPHMMAMQARLQLQQHKEGSPRRADLEQWAQILQQHSELNGGAPLTPPQFFNASLATPETGKDGQTNSPAPSPEAIQKTLEHAMSELLDRLAQLNEEGKTSQDMSPELQKAFAQVLRNENLRRGIAENLARAAPALSDPKCQGVLLSVYVPPPPHLMSHGKFTPMPQQPQGKQPNNMNGWFQKMLNNQDEEDRNNEQTEENRRNSKQKRVRTMAAAAAVMAAQNAKENGKEGKAERNLAKLENEARVITIRTPSDPVRAKSWDAWIARERGAVIFRQNRRVLNEQLEKHMLSLQEHTGTRGAGSSLRQMLSVRIIGEEMEDVMKRAIELEAAKAQRQHESPDEMHMNEMGLDVDITLSQLLLTEDGVVATEEVLDSSRKRNYGESVQFLHPSSLETALSTVCRISPSPAGGLSLASAPASHRSKEEIAALAQDKHERALLSQVVSPQDIGVTYDMIGGLSDVKELLRQSITYPLKYPHLYSEGIAREAVKGVLLFGPPGTGKTMLAKAVATEGGASFLSVDASSVENKWLGESEKNAKAVFTLARRLAPCVIFIDEVDSLLSSREGSSDDSAHGTLTSVKTTMMSEWDGLNSGTNGFGEAGSDRVIVIGSTNRPFDLDEAVLRRFPRRILVDLPDLETRKEILEVTLAENRLDHAVNLTQIAERLDGYTGSDIKEVCREAVVQISHEQAKLLDQGFLNTREDFTEGSLQRLRPVTMEDFEKALSKLKRSVSQKGRELLRVWEWNDEYGEIKKIKSNMPSIANMYL